MQTNMSDLMRALTSVDEQFNSDMHRAICDCATTERIAEIEMERETKVREIVQDWDTL